MSIVCVDPRTDTLWQRLVDQNRGSDFHFLRGMQLLTEIYGFEVDAQVVPDGVEELRVRSLFCRIVDIKGERIVSLPFSDQSGPLVRNRDELV